MIRGRRAPPAATIACMTFDLVLRGGLLIDGTGSPGRHADIGVTGDRITAIGDLSGLIGGETADVMDLRGLVVAPGFVDPHAHSDATVLVDGTLASHLRQLALRLEAALG